MFGRLFEVKDNVNLAKLQGFLSKSGLITSPQSLSHSKSAESIASLPGHFHGEVFWFRPQVLSIVLDLD